MFSNYPLLRLYLETPPRSISWRALPIARENVTGEAWAQGPPRHAEVCEIDADIPSLSNLYPMDPPPSPAPSDSSSSSTVVDMKESHPRSRAAVWASLEAVYWFPWNALVAYVLLPLYFVYQRILALLFSSVGCARCSAFRDSQYSVLPSYSRTLHRLLAPNQRVA